jgi:hypothetical protein
MKIIFIKDHSPRKKGDTLEPKTRDEIRVAEWYLANGIAKICNCGQGKGTGCADCDKKAEEAVAEAKAEEPVNLEEMTVTELKAVAEAKGIELPHNAKKAVIIAILTEEV